MKKICLLVILVIFPFMVLALPVGDVNGDGKVGTADYLDVRRHLLNNPKLIGDKLKRADVNNDGKVSASDYLNIRKIIMGTYKPTATPKPLSAEEKICESVKNNSSIDYKSFASLKKNNDDYYVIKAAHDCANKYNKPIKVTKGEYHIYKKISGIINVKTSTDFNNSNIYIHDESGIVPKYTGFIFKIVDDEKLIKKTKLTNIKKDSVIPELKQYDYALIKVLDSYSGKKAFMRTGIVTDGEVLSDSFRVRNGKVLDPITFEKEYKDSSYFDVYISNISSNTLYFKNATFYTVVDTNKYTRAQLGTNYMRRGIIITRNNTTVENINHYNIDSNKNIRYEIYYGYFGFFHLNDAADIIMRNCRVSAIKNSMNEPSSNASTYDIIQEHIVNVTFKNVVMSDYDEKNPAAYYKKSSNQMNMSKIWGVIGSNKIKNITYDGCVLNRIDSHTGVYNLNINNSVIGVHGMTLTGNGELKVNNSFVRYTNFFITLRDDYGGTWNGTMNIKNSGLYSPNDNNAYLIKVKKTRDSDGYLHDYGYDTHLPTVTLNNFTVYNNSKIFYVYNKSQNYFLDAQKKGTKDGKYKFYFPKQNYLSDVKNKTGKQITVYNYCGSCKE